VIPLIVKGGAGAAAQKVMGITVFSGMFTATFIAIFMVPVLYVAVERLVGRLRRGGRIDGNGLLGRSDDKTGGEVRQ
jgi:hypothetical protein